ncbi:MAG: thermonuclease family protein [Candidatus Heimdallarchaeota archaeon]
MELLILLLLVGFAVFMVGRSVSRTKRKIRKYTKPLRQKRSYQSPRKSCPQKQSTRGDRQKSSQVAYKTKAQSKAEVKERIKSFPEVKVEYIIDGDTVIVVKNWHKIKIRLDSIDCPEDGQHWGDTAKYGLIKLIGGRKVRLEEHGIDLYERTLATIYVQQGYETEWMNVNERMVTIGHAWVMRRFYDHLPKDRQDKLNRVERWARSKKVGLWQTPNPIPPWKWRSEGL